MTVSLAATGKMRKKRSLRQVLANRPYPTLSCPCRYVESAPLRQERAFGLGKIVRTSTLHGLSAYTSSRAIGLGVNLTSSSSSCSQRLSNGEQSSNLTPALKNRVYFEPRAAHTTPPTLDAFSSGYHLLQSISIYPAHNISIGYDLAVRSFKAIYLKPVVPIEVSRLPKSGLLAWIGPRRPIFIEMVSIENFPVRHFSHNACLPYACGPPGAASWYWYWPALEFMRTGRPVRRRPDLQGDAAREPPATASV